MIATSFKSRSAFRPHVRKTIAIWGWSSLVALTAAGLVVVQDVLYGGLPSSTPLTIAIAQYTLPWLTWAALAPALLFLFAQYPIDLGRPARGVTAYLALGVLAVGVKLLLSAPPAALLIWRPLGVAWSDGLRWLFAHRAAANLVMFWLFVGGYTAWRYYRNSATQTQTPMDLAQLERIPVRAGEGTAFVSVDDVLFIEAGRNQLALYTAGGRYTLRSTLSDLEQRLARPSFVRIHRSHIVNVQHVARIEPWGRGDYVVIMRNDHRLLSGKTYRDVVRSLLVVGRT